MGGWVGVSLPFLLSPPPPQPQNTQDKHTQIKKKKPRSIDRELPTYPSTKPTVHSFPRHHIICCHFIPPNPPTHPPTHLLTPCVLLAPPGYSSTA